MHRLEFHPLVEHDFLKAASYYNNISQEQFRQFREELKAAYQLIKRTPTHYLVLVKRRNVRRISLKGFEYSVIYAIRNDTVYVLAIKHHKQRNFWKNR